MEVILMIIMVAFIVGMMLLSCRFAKKAGFYKGLQHALDPTSDEFQLIRRSGIADAMRMIAVDKMSVQEILAQEIMNDFQEKPN